MKKRALASLIGVSERSISAYERGDQEPERQTLQRIAETLRFPEAFFFGDDTDELTPSIASFRALTKMTAAQRDTALGAGSVALLLNKWMEERFDLPQPVLPDLGRTDDPEAAADTLRQSWGLGELPIKHMLSLLESKGVRLFSLAIDAKEVDAFSMWYDDKPFMFLNTYKSAEHCRFDAAHELGHLVIHRHGEPRGREVEREADAFASAFLMPRRSVLAHAPRLATLPNLIKHKKHWTVSVAALNYRMHTLNLTTDWIYHSLCIQIAQAGYRTKEPEGAPHETSQVLAKVFAALREEGISKAELAKQLLIDVREIDELTFGLMLNVLNGQAGKASSGETRRAKLRLV